MAILNEGEPAKATYDVEYFVGKGAFVSLHCVKPRFWNQQANIRRRDFKYKARI